MESMLFGGISGTLGSEGADGLLGCPGIPMTLSLDSSQDLGETKRWPLLGIQGHLTRWESSGLLAEQLVRTVPLPDELKHRADGALVAVLRACATSPIGSLTWQIRPLVGRFDPDSGECLEAITASHAGLCVAIGTEDDQALRARAVAGCRMPSAWTDSPSGFSDAATSAPSCLKIEICKAPDRILAPRDSLQLHFVAAWKKSTDPNEVGPWLFVDQSSETVSRWAQSPAISS